MGEDGQLFAQVRPALADTILCYDESPLLHVRHIERCHECFTSSFSMENTAEIRVQADLDLLSSDSTFVRTPHAFCGY